MRCLVSVLVPFWVACGSPAVDLCSAPSSVGVAGLCAVDEAARLSHNDKNDEADALCATQSEEPWRSECFFQIAEARAIKNDLLGALNHCRSAAAFRQMCVGHALWLMSDVIVDALPGDTEAPNKVDAFVSGLPEMEMKGPGLAAVARAAAWHGIYAGSGSTDPRAARAATQLHASHARGAFAWEVVRLAGATRRSNRALVDLVWQTWQGAVPPLTGAPSSIGCWEVRLMPRSDLLSPVYEGTVRTFGGDIRYQSEDPQTDLWLATLAAIYAHGGDISASEIEQLRALPERAARMTAARYVGLDAESYPNGLEAYPSGSEERLVATMTRRSAILALAPHPYVPDTLKEGCP